MIIKWVEQSLVFLISSSFVGMVEIMEIRIIIIIIIITWNIVDYGYHFWSTYEASDHFKA